MLAAASTSQEDVAVSSVNLVYNEINFLCSEVIVKNHFLLHVIMDPYFTIEVIYTNDSDSNPYESIARGISPLHGFKKKNSK